VSKPRAACAVCGFVAALRKDGRVHRHWAGFFPARMDGTCQGWGELPGAQP
jgi:hypothetical protein